VVIQYLPTSHLTELVAGILLAVGELHEPKRWLVRLGGLPVALIALVALVVADFTLSADWWAFPVATIACWPPVAHLVLHRDSWISAALRFPPVVWLGQRSYAFYLWHYPIILLLHRQPTLTHWEIAAIALPLTLAFTAVSWRLIFVLNLPLAVVVFLAARHIPESHDETISRHVDARGATLGVLGLAGTAYALIEGPSADANGSLVVVAAIAGVACLVGFLLAEHRSHHPMLPLAIFRSRQFSVANILTFAVYGALGGVLFLLVVDLQQVLGYSAIEAGAAMLPITLLMLAFSARAGQLATRIGPRLPMSLGPLIITGGLVLMTRIRPGSHYLTSVFPSVVVFGIGLVFTVAPLTTTVLAAVESTHAGVASGVNNAVARLAGLVAVAVLPPLAGLTGAAYREPLRFSGGFHTAVLIGAGLCAAGAVVSALGIVNPTREAAAPDQHPLSCPINAPPYRTPESDVA